MADEEVDDEIVAEVRRIRDAHAKRFNYDLDAIFADLKRREIESKCKTVSLPPRRPKPAKKPA